MKGEARLRGGIHDEGPLVALKIQIVLRARNAVWQSDLRAMPE